MALDPYEHDVLAHALNERLDELLAFDRVPYLDPGEDPPSTLHDVVAELLDQGPDGE